MLIYVNFSCILRLNKIKDKGLNICDRGIYSSSDNKVNFSGLFTTIFIFFYADDDGIYIDDASFDVRRTESQTQYIRADILKNLAEETDIMIAFMPQGWDVPLGWNQVVAQAKNALLAAKNQYSSEEGEKEWKVT